MYPQLVLQYVKVIKQINMKLLREWEMLVQTHKKEIQTKQIRVLLYTISQAVFFYSS